MGGFSHQQRTQTEDEFVTVELSLWRSGEWHRFPVIAGQSIQRPAFGFVLCPWETDTPLWKLQI